MGHLLSGEYLQFSFLSAQLDLVLGAEDLGELKEVEQLVDVITDQCCVISLANTRNI